ncbi:MAG: hypothetical protein ACPGJV_02870 [Bacteriovoracaceae bacterium]
MQKTFGDRHNFGRQVTRQGPDQILKPRSVFWEYLFLSGKSPLRIYINEIFKNSNKTSPFQSIPDLEVTFSGDEIYSGSLTYLPLESTFSTDVPLSQYESLGAIVALLSWFGIGDLHLENIIISNSKDSLVVFPLDIESIFNDYILPSQTRLIPDSQKTFNNFGLQCLNEISDLDFTTEAVCAMTHGYVSSIETLNDYELQIYQTLNSLQDIENCPIRVIIRETKSYRDAVLNNNFSTFMPFEVEQLSRGDIPYFFSFFKR